MRAEVFDKLRELMNAADCYNEAMCQFARAKKRLQAP
jgi:hypothetical protein